MPASWQQKLQLKAGQTMVVLNAPDAQADELKSVLAGVKLIAQGEGTPDAVLLFVNNLAEAQRAAPDAIRTVKPDGLLWIAYPKGTAKVKTDVNRDRLWEALGPTGWRLVRLVALDDTWSVMRFRPADKVGK
ncbi:MAG: hypothetical protein FJ315_06115 [SAR202 cluster bacterium]|nr:hypothetical protein [SAR202 cluster bacterium]